MKIGVRVIPLDLTVQALLKISLSKTKFGILYFAFSLENFDIGRIIRKIFNVQN
jgi:hypothetical protein